MRLRCLHAAVVIGAVAGCIVAPAAAPAHGTSAASEVLPRTGPAPDFTLTSHEGTAFSTADLRGKVVALNFVFTRCADVCPIATYKMVAIQEALGDRFGRDVAFVSVTTDPDHDTPEVLAEYARVFDADTSAWTFLTGPAAAVQDVARRYGVYYKRRSDGEVEHILLTSLIDRDGNLRVQYLGDRFDPDEMLHDLQKLIDERSTP